MASRKEYEMLFQLNAKLGSGYTSTFKQAQSGFDDLQKEIRELQSIQSDISTYTKQQAAVEKTEAKLEELQKRYAEVQQQMQEAETPSASLEKQSTKLAAKIGDTSNALATQKERLGQTTASLNAAGIGTDNLSTKNADLADRISYLRTKQEAATESAQQFGEQGTSAIEAVSEAFAAAKVYKALGKIKDAFVEAAQASIEYESAVTGVYKTVDGTDEQLAQINDEIKEMATEMPASATEIASVAEAAGQLGIATEDVTDFTKVMIDLGKSTNMTADEAATALAKFANITGTSADNYSRLGSVIVDLGNNFATTESDITQMSTRLASAGKLAGLSEPEILALSAAMSSVGIEAEAGGTAMTQTLSGIEKAVAKGGDTLEEYARVSGMSAAEFSEAWENDAMSALTAFISGLGNLDEEGENTVLVLEELGLTGVRQSNMLKSLGLAADQMTSAVNTANKAWDENVALTNEANKRYGTTESKISAMKNSFTNLEIAVGDIFTPAIGDAAEGINELLQGATDFVEENPAVVKGLTTTVGVLGAAAAGVTGLTAAMKIGSVVAGTFGLASTAALGPIALGVAGVAALAGGIVALNSAVDDSLDAMGEWPPKLDELTTAADGASETLSDAEATLQSSAETTLATASAADMYISRLEEMGDYASLSTEEQKEYCNVLTLLTNLVPELGDHINTTTGEIEGGTAALRGYAQAWEESAKAQAYEEYTSEATTALNDVTKELYTNQLKLTEATTKYNANAEKRADVEDKLLDIMGLTKDEVTQLYGGFENLTSVSFGEQGEEVADLLEQWHGYNDEMEVAAETQRVYQEAIEEGTAKQQEAQQAVDEATTAYENLEAAAAAGSDAGVQGAAELGNVISTVQTNVEDLVESYQEAYTAAQESIEGQYQLWDEAADVSATSADKMNQNLEGQATYWEDYKSNLETLQESAGSIEGLSAMIASFADGSADSVNAIAGMADAAESGGGKLEEMVQNWQDLQTAQDEAAAELADLTTNFSSQMDELAQDAADGIAALDLSDEAAKNGQATIQAFIDSANSLIPQVTAAYANIGAAANSALQSQISSSGTSSSSSSTGRSRKTGAQATGTRNADPGWTLVGEYGPEIVYMQGGEGVLNAADTKALMQDDEGKDSATIVDPAAIGAMSAYAGAKAATAADTSAMSASNNVQIALSPSYNISGVQDASGVQDVLQQHTADLRQMVLDVMAEEAIDAKRRAF